MDVSVVIPTFNRLEQLRRILEGFENQTFPRERFEVLVVSDGSRDGTEAYLWQAKPAFLLRAFFQANQGAASARNLGVSQAVGKIVLFVDDDVFPLPQLIEEHVRSHDQYGDNAVVIGPMLAPPDVRQSPWVRWESEKLAEQYHDMSSGKWLPTARQFYTGNGSIARHDLLESGGFDPSFKRAEDVELAYRLTARNVKFIFNPHAAGYHYAERSLASWLAIPYAYGRNDVLFFGQGQQDWLLPAIIREYHTRHALLRIIVKTCLSQSFIYKYTLALLRHITLLSDSLHLDTVSSFACSGIFNVRYYEGVADQLGDRQAFLKCLQNNG